MARARESFIQLSAELGVDELTDRIQRWTGGSSLSPVGQAWICCVYCYTYNVVMKFEWDEAKQQSNLLKHRLDFVDAETVLAGATFTFADDRFAYNEERYITLGLLRGSVVVVAHTEREDVIRSHINAKGNEK